MRINISGIDHNLIAVAQAKAGSNVEQVNDLIRQYLLATQMRNQDGDRLEWRIMAEAKETALRVFVDTGNLTE